MAALRGSAGAKASVATGLVGLGVVIDEDGFTARIAAWGVVEPMPVLFLQAPPYLSVRRSNLNFD